ncbi:THUMP domain-containing protein 2 isoform X1 [Physeter macrocephalus]|uniref:U6 snRNA (guanine-N(2))-methyltransferase THUMPD2 n=2 Tax=Physeter macrocephalus TaxID=9755 RepID=A0A2Y9SE80_PHYMC|nr:THUMP domain-containing protein 2 isoform X1 [Physeter catodon]|eukprot:XP_023974600.1 THUMP domain-containing protein 2 isoform X1 [Physeter catodon]
MAAVPGGRRSGLAAGARFFCTAGRGLEPFLMREVRSRLAATQVEYISGKVFFTTCSDLNMLKKLKSAERLFLLIKKQLPFNVSSVSKGKIFNEMQRLTNDDPESWLNAISIWKNLLELDAKKVKLSQKNANPLKRKVGENDIIAKKLKTERMQEIQEKKECQLEKQIEEETLEQGNFTTKRDKSQEELQNGGAEAVDTHNQNDLTFRVSCRCSGAIAKTFTAQEVGRVIGIALMKQFGWKADLRNPNLEIFIHLSDIYSVVGIPVFRVPLASRAYIKTAGLRSTVAWAMASLAEIKAGAVVLDPMCGLGTILLEAAKEWPDVYYVGADVSDSQLLGACDNLKAAGLKDKIELLKVSVIELPLPSESVDIIISDIPFGKKFKLGKDIKHIIQEMERVLRVGGTIVLLLSEDHQRRLKGCEESSVPLNSKGSRTDKPGSTECLNPEGKAAISEPVSSSFAASNQECLDRMPPLGSLVPVECYRVSLGKTDALIYKYKKSHSPGQ